MISATSYESLLQQVESLKKELAQCSYAGELARENEFKYRRVLESTSEGFILLDRNQKITEVNNALIKVSGYSRQDFLAQPIEKFYDKATVDFYSASREHLSFEASFYSLDGRRIPMLFSRSTLKDDAGRSNGYMYFLTDLTELKATQEELSRAEQRYRSMYENAVQGMFQSRLVGELIGVNPSFASMLGYSSPDEVLALKEGAKRFYFSDEDRTRMIRAVQKKGAVVNYELQFKRKDGKPIWILANIRLIRDDKGEAILEGILVDNTKNKAFEKQLRRDRQKFRNLSNHDNLTGLHNTRYLYKALDELIEESNLTRKIFSLIFMDMDNFKRVVDTYGHLNGSQALKEVAATIKKCLRKPSFGVAYGGDEFVVVLPGAGKLQAKEKAEEIRARMKLTNYLAKERHNIRLGASFGLATFPEDTTTRTGLLALADKAMFHIKQTGKDSIGITQPRTYAVE
jgi:diguanylate cyclase (GGDEF)-like protein/PAS domain S-box-containing protein